MKLKLKRYSDTRLVRFLDREISKLRGRKSQAAIAAEAGFRQPNMLAMIKSGSSKLPLDRVPGLARALDCDAALLFRLALEQMSTDTTSAAITQIFRAIVTENEAAWLNAIREASDHSDPSLTSKAQNAIRTIFGR
ncbi:hypothetical protein ANRL2_01402 [Anaerolineae bacterium]|nr:hypothetical protein ANRL2_01402 [Anaerolineae bacterium]